MGRARRTTRLALWAGIALGGATTFAQSPAERWPAADQEFRRLRGSEAKAWVCKSSQRQIRRGAAAPELPGPAPAALSVPSSEPTDVLRYRLELELFPSESRLAGVNTITVRANQAGVQSLRLRLTDVLPISSITTGAGVPLAMTRVDNRTINITLDRPYNLNQQFSIRIAYSGQPVAAGLGSIMFQNTVDGPLVYSLSEPYYAYTWWPAKDGVPSEAGENVDRATVETWVTAPAGMRSLAAGTLQGVDTLSGGRLRHRWATQYEIPAYLVFFSSGPYLTWTRQHVHPGGVMPIEFNLLPALDTPQLRADWEQTVPMLDVFSQLFGPYPYLNEKYGIYSFGFNGGMEHPTSAGQGGGGFQLTAHELAHQWWGNAVTCRTWSDVWLSEGFASYAEALVWEHMADPPDPNRSDYWMNEMRSGAQWSSLPVYRSNTSSHTSILSPVVYNKGAWVLHQLRHLLGDATFFEILATYRALYENDAATTADFAALASDVAAQDLGWFFDQWVYRAGAPRLSYGWRRERIGTRDYAFISIDQTQPASHGVFRFPLDVEIMTSGGRQVARIWSDQLREHFVLPADGTITNVTLDPRLRLLKTGQQRVNYLAGPPKLLAATPAPESFTPLSAGTRVVTLQFSEALQSLGTVQLFDDLGRAVAFTSSYDAARYKLTLNLPAALSEGLHTVQLDAGFTSQAAGLAIDGEPGPAGAVLPSGDGLPGGSCTYTFRVLGDCLADIDGSQFVDFVDLLLLLGRYGKPGAGTAEGDITGDGLVSFDDLIFLLAAYGEPCE